MKEKIIALFKKYREIIVYVIVGGLTTVVSWVAKFLFNFIFYAGTAFPTPTQNLVLSIVNWVAGVAFAYPTNRKFVFESKDPKILPECIKFVLSRVSTLILDAVVMQILVAVGLDLYIATLISAVLVVIANYVFSKVFDFKKKDAGAENKEKDAE